MFLSKQDQSTIFKDHFLRLDFYPYLKKSSPSLDINGMISFFRTLPKVLLFYFKHVNKIQMVLILQKINEKDSFDYEEKRVMPFFDLSYRGFASEDMEKDAWPVRYFFKKDFKCPFNSLFL